MIVLPRVKLLLLQQLPIACVLTAAMATAAPSLPPPAPDITPDAARVEEIARLLPPEPGFCGPPRTDRAAWENFARRYAPRTLQPADKARLISPPPLSDEDWLEYARTGTRGGDYTKNSDQRRYRLKTFTLAECAANDGRFLSALVAEITAILDEKTWVAPAHDSKLLNYRGELVDVDLMSASTAATLGTTLALLGDALPADLVTRTRSELRRRIFEPYLDRIRNPAGPRRCYWINADHNWNAVCHAGVVLAALTALPDLRLRAEIVAGAEKNLSRYIHGFPADGYCLEGLGYWNYGFSHYVLLAETLYRLTDGKINLFADPRVKKIASYPVDFEMSPRVYPYFGDSRLDAQPMWWVNRLANPRLGLPSPPPEKLDDSDPGMFLYGNGLTAFPLPDNVSPVVSTPFADNSKPQTPNLKPAADAAAPAMQRGDPLRGWFSDAGILVARPGDNDPARLAVTLKGGRGGANHSHADLGQFVVALHGRAPLLDPGSENYNSKTFTSARFTIPRIGSFGHAVPVVAGQYQLGGKRATTRIVRIDFTDTTDTYVLDLAGAYDAPGLTRLERAFTYTRTGAGRLVVADTVEFSSPQTFGTALITMGTMKQESADTLLFIDGPARVRVKIESSGGPFTVTTQPVETNRPPAPTRIGIDFANPVTRASLRCTITPVE
ncbi:Heparinase II/III-like protein [Opitutaceae bacterium TAV1]|nr:Heparinase II/III-like protein [Opitutaceae bacterium TAV1]